MNLKRFTVYKLIKGQMNSNSNTFSENQQYSILDGEIKNKGFALLDEMFKKNGWHMTKNELYWISYSKFGHETEFFEIKLDSTKIYVSIPIKNSPYQYTTTFTNYFQASEYVEERFKEFI
jgi:hypothetical protein